MAKEVERIDPLDLRASVGVGVDIPFTGKAVFNSTYTTKDAIKANLINYFLTNKGERYFNPGFGSDVRLLLFENLTEASIVRLKSTVEEDITNLFPRVKINYLEITGDPESHSVRTYLKYSIKNSNVEDEILINIDQ